MSAIDFYFDFVSPYSYFAFSQREEIRRRTGQQLSFKPVYVGEIMKQVGNVPTSVTCPAKRAYLAHDIARWARRLGVPVNPHPRFGTFSTEPLVKAALRAGDDVEAFADAAFASVWVAQAPFGDDHAMALWLSNRGKHFDIYWNERDAMDDAHAVRVSEAVGHGAFGVPFFHTDKGNFFGNDRIDFLIEALAS